jgi:dTDP-4-dehydrorhamnose 3,5-epimerase
MILRYARRRRQRYGMQIEKTALEGVVIVTPQRFGDARGWFSETWNAARMRAAGFDLAFVQDNHSFSAEVGTLRGLHYQRPPHAQDKLVRCTRGAIFDVAVDFRSGSATYGQWVGVDLTAENGRQLLVPKGFLHGFVTRLPDTEVQYKCSDVYAPDCDGGVRWDDPDIGIDWGVTSPVLSAKDAVAPLLRDVVSPFSVRP